MNARRTKLSLLSKCGLQATLNFTDSRAFNLLRPPLGIAATNLPIDWNGEKRFNFKLSKQRPIVYDILYGGWNVYPVSSPVGTMGVSHRIANCPLDERAMGLIEAEFDNLFVRE